MSSQALQWQASKYSLGKYLNGDSTLVLITSLTVFQKFRKTKTNKKKTILKKGLLRNIYLFLSEAFEDEIWRGTIG